MTEHGYPDFLRQHFFHLYAIALADLRVAPSELEMLVSFGVERGISKVDLEDLLLSPAPFDPEIPPSREGRLSCLYDFARLAWADGVVVEEERKLLTRLCGLFGFEEQSERLSSRLLSLAETGEPPGKVQSLVEWKQ
ncbi:MAG: TerB family tellurite resistance protein [Rhodothermales bacterium]|nr:TerB family tellurite resistance protein [Rhodothermales bacterium]MBO6778679.1 TerB family tellurite resistance protein [Rhodothermales bacterium]